MQYLGTIEHESYKIVISFRQFRQSSILNKYAPFRKLLVRQTDNLIVPS